ncbi:hypothetical protein [Clostridium pasteurianum]|uniref:Uncharacterized protein n=1 Tax=Clostridium pasteurianum BC1 TaxID=86416 RepID=R4KF48_CLOPA|nr:hypothetical protein [Clostridium pasteurianum]AGK99164.1 hypothetical protein Clopa_4453 [Clostridium pasteurianum BC1]
MFDENKKRIIILSATITFSIFLLIFIFFNLSTLNEYNKYRKQLGTYIQNISTINSNVSPISNGQTIDIEQAKDKLPFVINSLIKVNKNLESYNSDSRYKAAFDSLKSGLDNNILMYKQLLSIVNNLESTDIGSSMQNVIKYKNNCDKYYASIKSSNKVFSLPKDSTTLINNASSYVGNFIKIKKDRDILNTQNMEFENNLNGILTKFNSIKVNLSYYAESARKNSISYDSALAKVQNNEDNFNEILQEFSQINVPQNQIKLYSSFNSLFNDYNAYVNSFSSALKKEKASSKSQDNSLNLSDLYKDSNNKYDTMNKDYSTLKNDFQNFVNNN